MASSTKRKPLAANWRVVYWVDDIPVRGPWRGRWLSRRYSRGRMTAAHAWRVFNALRGRQHVQRLELWRGRDRRLPR